MSVGLLANRVAVITGGADGLGWALARRFAEEGAAIAIADLRTELAVTRAEELAVSGSSVVGIGCDVTDEGSVNEMVAEAVRALGSLDVFVNNAGFTRDNVMRKMTMEDFQLVIDVHLRGAWLGTRAAVAAMREAGRRGSIVNMSSISGKVGNPGQTNYSAAKAGMIGLTKSSAKEVARYGIRVNALQPGLIRTKMTAAMDPDALNAGLAQVPLGRIGEPQDVANAALFLASDLSAYITGAVLEVTGGRHM